MCGDDRLGDAAMCLYVAHRIADVARIPIGILFGCQVNFEIGDSTSPIAVCATRYYLSRPAQRSLLVRPGDLPNQLHDPLHTERFDCFVTSTTAPIATSRSNNCRVGISPTKKPYLYTAHCNVRARDSTFVCDFSSIRCPGPPYFLLHDIKKQGLISNFAVLDLSTDRV